MIQEGIVSLPEPKEQDKHSFGEKFAEANNAIGHGIIESAKAAGRGVVAGVKAVEHGASAAAQSVTESLVELGLLMRDEIPEQKKSA